MGEEEKARKELAQLSEEHKLLDGEINNMTAQGNFDQLLLQRLKRRKLWLKDRISMLLEYLCDDIIA